uniref:upstream activation factor subunit spp27-like n=1 Tax=Erigeron canadensis TaxID=72917 RepID=UPI001CB9052B|nr:upstream activation factor subunit spp27-like [Erigeron canadensis]
MVGPAGMVSDSDLITRLREILATSDLTTTTTASVRRKLEEDFGIDLSDKKTFIRQQVDVYLQNHQQETDDFEEIQEQLDAVNEDENEEEDKDKEEEGSDEEEEASNGKSSKKRSKKQNTEVKKRGGGFTKLCSLSPQLQKLIGVPELARTEVVKQLWSYIKEHDLQDPANRKNIRCDGPLHELFQVDSIDMFQMNKALAKHIWPLDSDGASVSSAPKEKQRKERDEDAEETKRKEKRQKGGSGGGGSSGSGIHAPIPLSDALVKFLGTGENALARSDVVKRIWAYIKQNDLQDPSDKRRILCDDKLKELFDVDSFNGFTVSKLLTTHFIKPER